MKNRKKTEATKHINLNDVLTLLEQGDLKKAEQVCKEVIEKTPTSFDAHQLLGAIFLHKEEFLNAINFFDRSIKIDDSQAVVWSNRALALMGINQYEDALSSVNQALELNPNFVDAIYNKANILSKVGRFNEALIYIEGYLKLKPMQYLGWSFKAKIHIALKQLDYAINSYQEALRLEPNSLEVLVNLGMALSDNNLFEESLNYFDKALLLHPNFWQALQNKAVSFDRMGKFDKARECVKEALRVNPDAEDALLNLGIICQKLDLLDESLHSLNRLIQLNQKNAIYYFNRGVTFERLNRFDEAFNDYEKAIELHPDASFVNPRWNRALGLLCTGDLKRGWKEYESRFDLAHMENMPFHRAFRNKVWDGDPKKIKGKHFMVLAEQGLGDTIQFSRYVRYLIEMGAKVSLVVQKPLMNLFKSFIYPVELFSADQLYPEFDYYCSMMSLPYLLGGSVDGISTDINYLKADSEKVKEWKIRLGPKGREVKRVGLVWSGGFRSSTPELWMVNKRRNIELAKLKNLKTDGVEFHSLQVGELPESELLSLYLQNWGGPEIINHAQFLTDFTETAALLENLDLLISVDTSTPHLAGVLGRPVWLMNRFDTCWRWMLHRTDTPWYPNLRIFRQPSPGNWDAVAEDIKVALNTFIKN